VIALRLRGLLARPFLGSCGHNLRLGRRITFYDPRHISVGRDVYIAQGSWIAAAARISIEDEVLVGPYAVVVSSFHTALNGSFRFGPVGQAPVRIGRGSWLAAHVTVAAGADIGQGCLIGANSVVTSNIPDYTMAAGSPARPLKALDGAS